MTSLWIFVSLSFVFPGMGKQLDRRASRGDKVISRSAGTAPGRGSTGAGAFAAKAAVSTAMGGADRMSGPGGGMGRPVPSVGMMSGLPLEDPDMEPGRISVRVVDRSLDDSVVGARVALRDPATGKVIEEAATGSSGRVLLKASSLVGRSLVVTASSGGRTARSVVFEMPSGRALRFLLALSVPRRGAGMTGGGRTGGTVSEQGGAAGRGRAMGRGSSGEGSGASDAGRSGKHASAQDGDPHALEGKTPARGMVTPKQTGLWVEFRVRAVEDGKLTVTVTYLLDLASSANVAGKILPYPGGFEPMESNPPAWVQPGRRGLVVQSGLKPGRYSASVTGLLRHDGDTVVVDMTVPVAVRGYGVVVRRYPQDGPSVVGPAVVRRDMGGAYVAWVADEVSGRRIRFALVGLKVRSRLWSWLAVALAVGLVLAALGFVVFTRRPVENQV